MLKSLKTIALVCLAGLLFGYGHAVAIEPDPPQRLITAHEALAFKIASGFAATPKDASLPERRERKAIAGFYFERAKGFQWATPEGLNARARAIVDEIAKAGTWGLDPNAFDLPLKLPSGGRAFLTFDEQIVVETKLSLAVLKYARHARGGRLDPARLSLDFDRKPPVLDPKVVIRAVASSANPAGYLRGLHPRHEQFRRLRAIYASAISDELGSLTSVRYVAQGKRRKRSRRALSQAALLEKIRLNMELWRWMPATLGERHVLANIPEYTVRVIDRGAVVHQERIIVGKTKHKTPIFSDEMETIVFQPYWAVPNSIKIKEILPRLLSGRGPRGLKISKTVGGREIDPYSVNWHRTDIRKYVVYQPPGSRNALGRVKFLFPNRHAIYFHDTPTKHLFKRRRRAYSHGCMRVRNPLRFAQVLLGPDRGWGMGRVAQLSKKGPENNTVRLNRKIPVHVGYFTATVANDGKLKIFDDIYGHERLLRLGLAGKTWTLEKPEKEDLGKVRAQLVAKAGGRPRRRSRTTPGRRFRSALGAPVAAVTRRASVRSRRVARRGWRRSVFSGGDR